MEYPHHMTYKVNSTWTPVGKSTNKMQFCPPHELIRRTNEHMQEEYATTLKCRGPNWSKDYTIVLNESQKGYNFPDIRLSNVNIDATVKSIKISAIWIEEGQEYNFNVEGGALPC